MSKKIIKKIAIVVSLLVIIGIISIILIDLSNQKEIEKIEKNYTFSIEHNKFGFDVSTENFKFGILPIGGSSQRNFTIINNDSIKKKYEFFMLSDDNSSQWFSIKPDFFRILDQNEKQDFEIKVSPPKEIKSGNFSGKMVVIISAPKKGEKNREKLPGCFSKLILRNIKECTQYG